MHRESRTHIVPYINLSVIKLSCYVFTVYKRKHLHDFVCVTPLWILHTCSTQIITNCYSKYVNKFIDFYCVLRRPSIVVVSFISSTPTINLVNFKLKNIFSRLHNDNIFSNLKFQKIKNKFPSTDLSLYCLYDSSAILTFEDLKKCRTYILSI